MVDTDTGELIEKTPAHEGSTVREFYAGLEGPGIVGIEATGSMQWFLEPLDHLRMECRVDHPAKIRAAEPHGWTQIRERRSVLFQRETARLR
jgi:hypothetical protein